MFHSCINLQHWPLFREFSWLTHSHYSECFIAFTCHRVLQCSAWNVSFLSWKGPVKSRKEDIKWQVKWLGPSMRLLGTLRYILSIILPYLANLWSRRWQISQILPYFWACTCLSIVLVSFASFQCHLVWQWDYLKWSYILFMQLIHHVDSFNDVGKRRANTC
jgi:hypothetical protein